jgi:hypothetical protein
MKNSGKIIRSKKTGKSRYTPISNDILQSKVLTPEQKSILVHLLSLPEDWIVYKTEIWKDMNIGRDRFDKHWRVLVGLGYIVSIKVIDENTNLIKGYNHIVYEEPISSGLLTTVFTESQGSRNSGCIQSNKLQSNNLKNNKLENNNISILEHPYTGAQFDEDDIVSIMSINECERNEAINYLNKIK